MSETAFNIYFEIFRYLLSISIELVYCTVWPIHYDITECFRSTLFPVPQNVPEALCFQSHRMFQKHSVSSAVLLRCLQWLAHVPLTTNSLQFSVFRQLLEQLDSFYSAAPW